MYSMNYIGKFIANFREFYNDINGATLTGAIDVVVVEQPDGSFNCSPFHVRFGKLGVLRSRFKVVDLELNGEPLNIHMKLGESGEAFFVEEVGEDDEECSAHLVTSPIPVPRFHELYEPRRRNSLSAVEPDHGQASDYTKRRYTADGQSLQKPDFSKLTKQDTQDLKNDDIGDHEALFEMDGLDEVQPKWTDNAVTPKTFAATELATDSEANKTVQKISAHNDFRPIETPITDDVKQNSNGKKKKKTRKVGSKKKHQRKSSTSSLSSQSDRAGSEQRTPQTSDLNFFSDTEVNASIRHSENAREPSTPVQSDTELELARGAACESKGTPGSNTSDGVGPQSWRWGELPEPPSRNTLPCESQQNQSQVATSPDSPASLASPISSDEERGTARRGVLSGMFRFMSTRETEAAGGVYLEDLHRGQVDPDLYFPKHHADQYRAGMTHAAEVPSGPTEEEYESGNGPSLPQSPASLEPPVLDSDDDDKILTKGQVGVYVREEGAGQSVSRALQYEEFCERGGELLAEGRLVVRLGDRYLPWRSAGPLLLSLLAYRRPPPNRMLEALEKECGGSVRSGTGVDSGTTKSRGYSWWSWRRTNQEVKSSDGPNQNDAAVSEAKSEVTQSSHEDKLVSEEMQTENETKNEHVNTDDSSFKETTQIGGEPSDATDAIDAKEKDQLESSSDSDEPQSRQRPTRRHSSFRKTLRLSSEQIRNLKLRDGMNEMVFSVTTAYQGTTRCKCNVFRWRHDDKIVISDIDGTITKSDVLGHIFPLVGKDWAQSGVAQLFTKIKNNGYQLLYLSARAIGQAKVTREYLRSIRQGEVCLPDGPLLLNPTSLLRAFHREVIEKKPEEFKIQCLADIKALFPQGSNPFYAGYGNRVNDVCAYQAVGIPIVRIFTINYKGELKHELTQTFQSTYSHMSVLVDQVFPPALCEPSDEFSQVTFWREPIQTIDVKLVVTTLTPRAH